MPEINIHGKGSNAQSNTSTSTTNAYTAATEKAGKDAAMSAIPWANPKLVALNARMGKWLESEAAKAASAAQKNISSSIPWMNSKVASLGTKLQQQAERQATRDYNARVKEFSDQARTALRLSQLRQRQATKEFNDAYRNATAENKLRSANDPFTYRSSNASRLGSMGQRAFERGDWRTGHAAVRELDQVSQRYGAHVGVANAVRMARQRIRAAQEGQSGWRLRLGSIAGRVLDGPLGGLAEGAGLSGATALALENPYTAIALGLYKLAKAGVAAPFTLADKANSLMAGAQPYLTMRDQLASLGRAGGFSSRDLERQLRGDNPALNSFGIGPQRAAELLQHYGIAPGDESAAMGVLQSLGKANYLPSLGGLGNDFYARAGAFGAGLGLFTSRNGTDAAGNPLSDEGMDKYFRMLQKTTATAVQLGLDRAQSLSRVQQLLASAAQSGGWLGSGKRITEMANSVAANGSSFARSGAAAASIAAAANTQPLSTGYDGDNARNGVIASFISNSGGVKAFADPNDKILRQMIGEDRYRQIKNSNVGRQELQDLRQAAQSGNMMAVIQMLQPFTLSDSKAQQYEAAHSYLPYLPKPLQTIATARFLGLTTAADAERRAGNNGGVGGGGLVQGRWTDVERHYGLPPGSLSAIESIESGGRSGLTSSAGAQGQFQIMPATAQHYARGGQSVWDENDAADIAAQDLRDEIKRYGSTAKGVAAYNMGDPSLDAVIQQWGPAWRDHIPGVTQKYLSDYERMTAAAAAQAKGTGDTQDPDNDTSPGNVARARTDSLSTNASSVYYDSVINALNGGNGSAVISLSNKATGLDQTLVGAASAVAAGLESAGSAAERFASRLDALLNDAGHQHPVGPRRDLGHGGSWLLPPGLGPDVGFHNQTPLKG